MPYITEYAYRPVRPSPQRRLVNGLLVASMLGGIVAIATPFWPGFVYNTRSLLPHTQHIVAQAQAEAEQPQPPGAGNWLLIPSIGVKAHVLEGPDVSILDREMGVWHQTGSIGEGNLVIAGHRFKYLPPNQATFYLLDRLKIGDQLILWWEGRRHVYTMASSKTVGRNATEILNATSEPQLTLYTCTDLNASHRLVVIARPVLP